MPSVELHIDAKMAALAHMLQVLQIPAQRIAFAEMSCSEDYFPFRPMRWFSISFDATARAWIGLVKSAF